MLQCYRQIHGDKLQADFTKKLYSTRGATHNKHSSGKIILSSRTWKASFRLRDVKLALRDQKTPKENVPGKCP